MSFDRLTNHFLSFDRLTNHLCCFWTSKCPIKNLRGFSEIYVMCHMIIIYSSETLFRTFWLSFLVNFRPDCHKDGHNPIDFPSLFVIIIVFLMFFMTIVSQKLVEIHNFCSKTLNCYRYYSKSMQWYSRIHQKDLPVFRTFWKSFQD